MMFNWVHAVAAVLCSGNACGQVILSEDFDDGAAPGFANARFASSPDGGRRILGTYANEAVALTLADLTPGRRYQVRVDVLAFDSWEGDAGPDRFTIAVDAGPSWSTTFSNDPARAQSYPSRHGFAANPGRTGGDPGGEWWCSAAGTGPVAYPVELRFSARSSTHVVRFSSSGLSGVCDESWGLDDLTVTDLGDLPDPTSDRAANPIPLDLTAGEPVTVRGSTLEATPDPDAPACPASSDIGPAAWYRVQGTGRRITASTCAYADFDTRLSVYCGTGASATCLAAEQEHCGPDRVRIRFCSEPGRDYLVRVGGVNGATGAFDLQVGDKSSVVLLSQRRTSYPWSDGPEGGMPSPLNSVEAGELEWSGWSCTFGRRRWDSFWSSICAPASQHSFVSPRRWNGSLESGSNVGWSPWQDFWGIDYNTSYRVEFEVEQSVVAAFRYSGVDAHYAFQDCAFTLERVDPQAAVVLSKRHAVPWRGPGVPYLEHWFGGTTPFDRTFELTAGRYILTATVRCEIERHMTPPFSADTRLDFDLELDPQACAWLEQPRPVAVPTGGTARFSARHWDSSSEYQWRRDGVPLASSDRIVGVRSSHLVIHDVGPADAGEYTCSAGGCASDSAAASLSVDGCAVGQWRLAPLVVDRRFHAQASTPDMTVIVGGLDSAGSVRGDGWVKHAGDWATYSARARLARSHSAIAGVLPNLVCFVGGRADSPVASSVRDGWLEWPYWPWNQENEDPIDPNAAPGGFSSDEFRRSEFGMACMSTGPTMVLFGGIDSSGAVLADAWACDFARQVWPSGWSRLPDGPPARHRHAMAFDPFRGEVIVVGGRGVGGLLDDTWAWNGESWRQGAAGDLTPREFHAVTYDAALGRVVLYGGLDASGARSDRLAWDGHAWRLIASDDPPGARWGHAMSFDQSSGSLIISGGIGADGTPRSDVWEHRVDGVFITSQPQAQRTTPGSPAVFAVTASADASTFRWRRNGVELADDARTSGARSSRVTIASVEPGDQGRYDCLVGGSRCEVASAPAILDCSPVFVVHPVGGSVVGGATITLAAEVRGGPSTFYQWSRDGTPLVDSAAFAGVSTPTLVFSPTQPADSGVFSLAASNSCGTVTSRIVRVDVTCLGDFNRDGGVDGSDVSAFFDAWAIGALEADVNADGGVDGQDLFFFFERWQGGC